ncbi:MAG: hypothetical protein ACQEQV_08750 [Fibrobacterota bacterium]
MPSDAIEVDGAENGLLSYSNSQYDFDNGMQALSAYGKYNFDFGLDLGLSGYIQQSDGVGRENSKLYGLPSWNFPQWISPDPGYNAFPPAPYDAVGSNGKFPAKYMISTQAEFKGFDLYARYSHAEKYGAGLFYHEPDGYNDVVSDDKQTIENYLTEIGKEFLISNPNHLFWAASEAWGENRRIYGTHSVLAALKYTHDTPLENKWEFKLSQALLSEYIEYEDIATYSSKDESEGYMEQFGEKRTTFQALYLLNSVENLKLALGSQYRYDNIGEDMQGNNQLYEDSKKPIVSNVEYHNFALFTEGSYDLRDEITLHGGIRLDKHTRTDIVPSPKLSVIYKPWGEVIPQRFKLFYQTSSNNGSADSYEPNRYTPRDDEGNVILGDYFEDPSKKPQPTEDIIRSVTMEELHSLEPEKTRSLEFSSYSAFLNNSVQLETSVSYNTVENLFMWNQDYYHVFNTTDYSFGVAEGELRYVTDKFNIGLNHSFTELHNMDYRDHYTVINRNRYDRQDTIQVNGKDSIVPTEDWYKNTGTAENPYYVPVASGTAADSMNAIYNMVSIDNSNFLNLAPNLSKFYIDYYATDKLHLHFDTRIFWSPLKGRKVLFDNQKEHNSGNFWWAEKADWMDDATWNRYSEWYAENGRPTTLGIEDKPVVKANLATSYDINDGVSLSMGVKDFLSDPNSDNEFIKRNSLRWQVMVDHGQQGLFTSDVRRVYGRIDISF